MYKCLDMHMCSITFGMYMDIEECISTSQNIQSHAILKSHNRHVLLSSTKDTVTSDLQSYHGRDGLSGMK
jgi:hypothetical protein